MSEQSVRRIMLQSVVWAAIASAAGCGSAGDALAGLRDAGADSDAQSSTPEDASIEDASIPGDAAWSAPLQDAAFAGGDAAIPPLNAGTWTQITNTKIRSVLPPNPPGEPKSIVNAWSGGTVDTKRSRLIVTGGGHLDYAGNEIYAYDAPTGSIVRLTDPSADTNNPSCAAKLSDGRPTARHTYGGLAYIAHADKLFMIDGSRAPCGDKGPDTWTFDFATQTWEQKTTNPLSTLYIGVVSAYDPTSQLVYIMDQAGFYSYDLGTDKFAKLGGGNAGYHVSATIDTKRRKFIVIGDAVDGSNGAQEGVISIDLVSGVRTTIQGTGAVPPMDKSPGITYDPTLDRLVVWNGGGTIYFLDSATGVWTQKTPAGGPTSAPQDAGTFGRFGYIPNLGIHVLLNDIDENVFVYRP